VSVDRNDHSDDSRVQAMRIIRAMGFRVSSHVSGSPGIRSPDRTARSSVAIPTELPGPQILNITELLTF